MRRQRVGDVAGQRELLDPRRAAACAAAARARSSAGSSAWSDVRRVGRVGASGFAAALAELAVLEHRGVVGAGRPCRGRRRRHRADAAARPAARERRRSSSSADLGLGRRAAEQRGRGAREPGRAPGRPGVRGDHQHAEDGEQHQQRHDDDGAAQQVHEQRGDHEADARRRPAAGPRCRRGAGCGHAVGDVHDAEHAEQQRRPADDLAAGGAVALGVAQVAPARRSTAAAARTSRAGRPSRSTTVRVASPTPPGSCHQTAAATTTARPIRNRPAPSRRCSGSRSRAVWPTLRTARADARGRRRARRRPDPRPEGEPNAATGASAVADRARGGTRRLLRRAPLRLRASLRDWLPDDRVEDPDPFEPALWRSAWRCPCSATPAGKTYGSPCSRIYTARHTSHRLTRRVGAPHLGRRTAVGRSPVACSP